MDCPRCEVELTEISNEETALQRCGQCGGVWVDSADLNRVLLHANLPALSTLGGFVNPDEITASCPVCHVDLVAVEGGEKRSLYYETCESCGGIWLEGPDDDEIPESLDWKAASQDIVGFYRNFRKK